jgi:hypothetical protein
MQYMGGKKGYLISYEESTDNNSYLVYMKPKSSRHNHHRYAQFILTESDEDEETAEIKGELGIKSDNIYLLILAVIHVCACSCIVPSLGRSNSREDSVIWFVIVMPIFLAGADVLSIFIDKLFLGKLQKDMLWALQAGKKKKRD